MTPLGLSTRVACRLWFGFRDGRWSFAILFLAVTATRLSWAETIAVPNGSFESPATPFVEINIDHWQKTPRPDWYEEDEVFLWSQLTGLFRNTAAGSPDHIDNCDGNQAVWLFAVPGVGLYQDYDSVDWNDPEPGRAFDVRYKPGTAYRLTAGIIGAGGGMSNGVTLELSLYYRDANSNAVTVASTTVTNLPGLFGARTRLVDFHADLSAVRPGDPWAGHPIGLSLLSTVRPELQGGYWDLDHVRLAATTAPLLSNPAWEQSQFSFELRSEPGLVFEILGAADLGMPPASWDVLATVTNTSGLSPFIDPNPAGGYRFFQARQID